MERTEGKALPEAFVLKMQGLLGDEAEEFFKSYDSVRSFGLRRNPLKGGGPLPSPFDALKKIPWAEEGFYYEEPLRPGKHPFHEAGVFYIQEPSAMAVAEALAPKPGERILDLCAAPGGKSTHLAGKMDQRGLLVCNEIHPARAKILSQNVERMGVGNAVVTNMEPAGLIPVFGRFFDGIVVDAPCSGEGMFRKDENAREEWSPDHVTLCAGRQDMILDCADQMLKPGGRIAYSTCTFSPEENEKTIARFLERHKDYRVVNPALSGFFSPGRPEWADGDERLKSTVRIWPHKVDGEGHFLAILLKNGAPDLTAPVEKMPETAGKKGKKNRKEKNGLPDLGDLYDFCGECLTDGEVLFAGRKLLNFGDNVYLAPEITPELAGLKVLRPGLHVGTIKKGRLEPSHALALFLKKEEVKQSVEIGTGALAEKYLRGEVLTFDEIARETSCDEAGLPKKGWVLITTGGYSLGWAKAAGGVLKNHYPKGLRRPY